MLLVYAIATSTKVSSSVKGVNNDVVSVTVNPLSTMDGDADGAVTAAASDYSDDTINVIGYSYIYVCRDVSNDMVYDTTVTDSASASASLTVSPLHIVDDDTAEDCNDGDDASDCTGDSSNPPQYPTHATGAVTSAQMSLRHHTKSVLLLNKAMKAYQIPQRIKDTRVSFVKAYTHIDTFAQSRKNTGVADTATVTDDTDVSNID